MSSYFLAFLCLTLCPFWLFGFHSDCIGVLVGFVVGALTLLVIAMNVSDCWVSFIVALTCALVIITWLLLAAWTMLLFRLCCLLSWVLIFFSLQHNVTTSIMSLHCLLLARYNQFLNWCSGFWYDLVCHHFVWELCCIGWKRAMCHWWHRTSWLLFSGPALFIWDYLLPLPISVPW